MLRRRVAAFASCATIFILSSISVRLHHLVDSAAGAYEKWDPPGRLFAGSATRNIIQTGTNTR